MEFQKTESELLKNANILIKSQNEVEQDSAFRGIMDSIFDFGMMDFATEKTSSKNISMIYISQKLIHDFWSNFATDASFGLENVKDLPYFKDFLINLGKFLKYSIEEKHDEAYSSLNDAIYSYYKIIFYVNEKLGSKIMLK